MTMNNAIQAYKASRQFNQNPRDILANVHSDLYRAIVSAKAAQEQKRLDIMCDHVAHSVRILTVLVATLNFSAVGRDGATLRAFYQRLLSVMNGGDSAGNGARNYDTAAQMLRPLCNEFHRSN
jgi:flagellin-specific chaperone FliS